MSDEDKFDLRPAFYGCSYGYYNNRECYKVYGPSIPTDNNLFSFANPKLAEEMCVILHRIYMSGATAAKEQIKAVLTP